MAAINQRIPNFLGGVSQQPDSIKFPGQLRVCDNAVPDVTFGLTKRPPGEFVNKLTNATDNGYWYEILRDGDEKFLIQIDKDQTSAKPIRIWTLNDITVINTGNASTSYYEAVSGYTTTGDVIPAGKELELTNSSGDSVYSYLSGAEKPYSLQTIQDLIVIANPSKTVGTTGTVNNNGITGDACYVKLDTVAYNTEYVLYKGNDTPDQMVRYKVTEIEAVYDSIGGESSFTVNGASTESGGYQQQYSGQAGFGDSTAAPMGDRTATGRILVNANSYLYKNEKEFDGNGDDASDFLGYKATYNTKYYGTATLKHGGNYASDPVDNNSGQIASVTIGQAANNDTKTWYAKAVASRMFHTYENVTGTATYRTPESADDGSLNVALVLEKLKDKIDNNALGSSFTTTIVGNGLFIQGTGAHTINFLGGVVNEGMTVIGRTVTDVGQLPPACKHGFTVEVSNTENTESDNYFLKFVADAGAGNSGVGRWEECACPNDLRPSDESQILGLNPATMPHGLKNNRNGTFTFGKLDKGYSGNDIMDGDDYYWKDRDVGDIESNPIPTFDSKEISQVYFHRNRLGFVAGEQIVLSRPGDYFNFFNVSAITTSDDNPIDITVSDVKPAYINHILPAQAGIMMFSDNGQFLLYTENDIFSPKTARLKKISSYECDPSIDPVDMGTSTMWASTVGAYTRTFEAVIVDANAPPKIIEQTRVVPEFIPKDITLAANSAALGMVTYGKKGGSNLYHYKYFDSGERRDQSAWFSWTLTGTLQHALYTAGDFFAITKQGSDFVLSRHEYVTASDSNRSYTLGTGTVGSTLSTSRWFEACLDNMQVFTSGWSYADPLSSLTLGYSPTDWTKIYLVVLSGDEAGAVIKADSSSSGTTAKFSIDLTSGSPKVAVGYRYDTLIELPTYYSAFEPGKYDLDGDLRISGINFEMGVSGPMEFELSSKHGDVDTYTQYESGMLVGTGQFSKPPAVLNKSVRVPIQRKNDKYTLKVKIPDPFSTSLISASWDGRYNTRQHVRK